jgi:hypothetical protein
MEFSDERWMKDFVEGNTEEPSQGGFAVTGEDVIEVRLDGRSESAIVSGPQLGDASGSRLPSHRKDVISLLEVEGEAHDIPAAAKSSGELSLRWILKNANAGQVLAEKAQAEGDTARHGKAPAEIARCVFTEIVVEAGIATTRGEENTGHGTLPGRFTDAVPEPELPELITDARGVVELGLSGANPRHLTTEFVFGKSQGLT